jgi:hypothetical protein
MDYSRAKETVRTNFPQSDLSPSGIISGRLESEGKSAEAIFSNRYTTCGVRDLS